MRMGVVTVTAYPSRYAHEPDSGKVEELERKSRHEWRNRPAGGFFLRLGVVKIGRKQNHSPYAQRELARLIGEALGMKPEYDRRAQGYDVGTWHITGSNLVTDQFDINSMEDVLNVLERLKAAGYVPDEAVYIHFQPEEYDLHAVLNLSNIMEARNKLIVQALGLTDDIRIIVDEELAFGIPLDAFSFETLEACIYLLRQGSIQAASVGKARMKPCDNSNPRYQMRTWLLRLGFVGEEFARPRHTLLCNLKGNGAFFDEQGQEKAAVRLKARRMTSE